MGCICSGCNNPISENNYFIYKKNSWKRKICKECNEQVIRNGYLRNQKKVRCYIYIVTHPSWPEFVKIGRSTNIERRLESYHTACPYRAHRFHYYTIVDDVAKIENIFRDRFGNEYGEWYKIDKDLAKSIIEEYLDSEVK